MEWLLRSCFCIISSGPLPSSWSLSLLSAYYLEEEGWRGGEKDGPLETFPWFSFHAFDRIVLVTVCGSWVNLTDAGIQREVLIKTQDSKSLNQVQSKDRVWEETPTMIYIVMYNSTAVWKEPCAKGTCLVPLIHPWHLTLTDFRDHPVHFNPVFIELKKDFLETKSRLVFQF